MTYDTLTYDNVEKSLADWGFTLSSVRAHKRNQAPDEFTATIGNTDIVTEGTTPTFPFEAVIVVRSGRTLSNGVYSGGIIKFVGKRIGQPLKATSSGHGVTYKFKNAWYDLENTHYQQGYASGNGNVSVVISETVLFAYANLFSHNGKEYAYGLISVGSQINFILQWLLDIYVAQGLPAPFQFKGVVPNTQPTAYFANNGIFFSYQVDPNTTISNSLFGLWLPSQITKPLMCADALQKCLEFSPRANIWFDYTTVDGNGNPLPTVHVTNAGDKVPVSLPLFDGVSHKSISIQRRDDLLLRAALICYRITNTYSGDADPKKNGTFITYAVDKWGAHGFGSNADPSAGLRVLTETVDLTGVIQQSINAFVDTEPVEFWSSLTGQANQTYADHVLKRNWWQGKRGGEDVKLADTRTRFQYPQTTGSAPNIGYNIAPVYIDDAVVTETQKNDDGTLTEITHTVASLIAAGLCDKAGNLVLNRVVEGTTADWMTRNDGQPLKSLKVRVTCQTRYAVYDIVSQMTGAAAETDIAGNIQKAASTATGEQLSVNLVLTNAVTDTYQTVQQKTQGEGYQLGNGGIAQYLYQHLDALQYDGDAVHVKVDFDAGVNLGNALNLSNGAPEWATMNAQIQSIEESYGTHETSVQIGVAKHLNSGQISSLLNMWRYRRTWYNPAIRSDAQAGGGGGQTIADSTAQANTTQGLSAHGQSQNIHYLTEPSVDGTTQVGQAGGIINHDPKLVTTITQGKVAVISGDPSSMFKMQPREVQLCDNTGTAYKAVAHITGGHKDS